MPKLKQRIPLNISRGFAKPHKYFAKKTEVDGIVFDSKAESEYYSYLKMLELSRRLNILELQPTVFLTDARLVMRLDFLIYDERGKVWIDVKGFETPVFKIKKRLWKHYGPGRLELVKKSRKINGGFNIIDEVIAKNNE